MVENNHEIKRKISKSYANALKSSKQNGQNCCGEQDQSCCEDQGQEISFGCYLMDEELNHFLKSGMTVVDFGSVQEKTYFLLQKSLVRRAKL